MDRVGYVKWRLNAMLYSVPGAAATAVLLAVLVVGEAVGQPGGDLFRAVQPASAGVVAPDSSSADDSVTLRRRLVAIDFAQLTPPAGVVAVGGVDVAPSGVLRLNLFDDAVFTGRVERVAPTFSGGYSVSGRLAGVEMGTVTLVVNGAVVAGTVRTPDGVYRIRPAGDGLHAVSEIDPARLPPLGEPVLRQRWGGPPPIRPDGGGGRPPR